MAGMMAHIISAPRGEFGMDPESLAWLRGMKAARRIATSAMTQSAAAIQKIGSASDWRNPSV